MTTATLTLTDFLLARIAEDEDLAGVAPIMRLADGVESHNPARVLAECEAKRQIVEVVSGWKHMTVEDCWYSCSATYGTDVENACCNDSAEGAGCDCGLEYRVANILTPLAGVYADHPDFNDDWLP